MFNSIQLFLTCKRINKYYFIVLSFLFLKLMFVLVQTPRLIAKMLFFSLQMCIHLFGTPCSNHVFCYRRPTNNLKVGVNQGIAHGTALYGVTEW